MYNIYNKNGFGVSLLTFYNFISSILSYVFTFIIYLFIFGVIRLIYLDVKKMSRFESDDVNANDVPTASLKTLPGQTATDLKRRYTIYENAVIGRNKNSTIRKPQLQQSFFHYIFPWCTPWLDSRI